MAEKDAPKDAKQAVQDLPPTHPNDPTETTLTQEQAPDDDAQAKAIAARVGDAGK